MFTGMKHTHVLVVSLFLLLYLIKTALLVLNKHEMLDKFSRKTKVAEMIISTLFLLTGIYLVIKTGDKGSWLWMKIFVVACSIPLAIVAFKRKHNAMALLSLMFLVYAYGISETKSPFFLKDESKTDFNNTSNDALGKTIFETKCVSCHGTDGKLGLSGAKDLGESAMTHDEIINIVSAGKNSMMSFKEQLSQAQIDAVATYVESLRK